MEYWMAAICLKAFEVLVAVILLKAKSESMQPVIPPDDNDDDEDFTGELALQC